MESGYPALRDFALILGLASMARAPSMFLQKNCLLYPVFDFFAKKIGKNRVICSTKIFPI